MRPGKAETYRIRMTIGGDRLDAFQDVRSPAIGIIDTKLHVNSTISDADEGARYATCDIKDFYLGSKVAVFQYMKVHRRYVPQEIIDEYGLTDDDFDAQGYIYLEIQKGMYGLKEAGILAFEQLQAHLKPYGYEPMSFTPGLWRHVTRRTTFTLAVDDFGIKYFSKADAEHLFSALRDKYTITTDWSKPSQPIGPAPLISASLSTGITKTAGSTCPCRSTYRMPWPASAIHHRNAPSTHRTFGPPPSTDRKSNLPTTT
jgi:hypothetical protein